MTKKELRALADRHEMEILRDPITDKATWLYKRSETAIEELDYLAERNDFDATYCVRTYDLAYTYKINIPDGWIDLWGWTE